MKKNHTLEIRNQVKNTAELLMYGEVSPWELNAKKLQEELKNLDSSVTELNVRMFSPGGDVFEGIAIYNILKRSDKKITMHIDGLAASIASVIILAADEIVIGEGSQIMIHSPYCFCMGNSTELQSVIDRLDMTEREMIKIYQRATGLSDTEITSMMSAETWFNDDQAVEFGFATMKAGHTNRNIAASVKNCEWIKRKELAKVNLEFKNRLQENINKINDMIARK